MNIRNCRMCGHIFNYVAGPFLCPHCREKMEAKFQEVKEYIRNNPGVSIQDVSENCDVEPSQIQQWLREERLELTEGSSILLNCEKCGAPIRSGRFCEKCKYDMAMDLQSVTAEEADCAPAEPQNIQRRRKNALSVSICKRRNYAERRKSHTDDANGIL